MYGKILRATGTYVDYDVELFEKAITVRRVGKNELLLRKGDVARSVYYILDGAVRQYDVVSESEHNVIDLHIDGEWFLNYESLIAQRPSKVFIETFTECKLIEITLETVHYLTGKSLAFLQLNRVLEGALTRMQFFDQSMTPLEKYRSVLDHRPGLIQTFPLKMVSSFLKMTPETLSRVRRAAAKGAIS